MTAQIIDGKVVADEIRQQVAEGVRALVADGKRAPGLATVLVGDDPASHVYVRSKHRACQSAGIQSFGHVLPADSTQDTVEGLVRELNQDERVSGILVQLPMPGHLDEERILSQVSLEKDVDGFHPVNIGRLAMKGRTPKFTPCTPAGCMELARRVLPTLAGVNAVVLGRSNIVGMPVALLLLRANATVTVCHSYTQDLPAVVRQADLLVTAIGRPGMVRGDWVKPGAVVIDVGINRIDDPSSPKGSRLVGDVAFDEAKEVAGAITPVPGGVGLMTIAMLLQNTLRAAQGQ